MTVALAAAVFGEALTAVQLAGGVLVLGTVLVLNAAVRLARARDGEVLDETTIRQGDHTWNSEPRWSAAS